MERDLTSGGIRRQLLALSAPLLLGSILQQLYNAADTLIVQRFAGDMAFSAVGVAGAVMNLFIFLLGGACAGVSIVMASLYGGRDMEGLRRESFIATVYGLAFSVVLALVSILLLRPVLHLIQTPGELMPMATEYLVVIFAGMPATFLYNLCAAALRAMGDTAHATIFLLAAVIINVVLDIVLVGPCGMGVAGAALATVISQLLAAMLSYLYIHRERPFLLFKKEDMRRDPLLLKRTVRFSAASALNQSSLYIGKLLVQGVVNSVGLNAIAGFTAASRIEAIINSFGVSGGEALSVFIAQNLGAGDRHRARDGFQKGLVMLVGTGAVLAALMYLSAEMTVSFFVGTDSPGSLTAGVTYLQLVALFYVIAFVNCALLGWNRGNGELDIFMIGTAGQVALRALGSWLLAPYMGIAGVALATGIGWILLFIFKGSVYLARKKKEVL